MSSKPTKGMRARKIFRALNIDYAPETKRTKQSATKHEEESSDSKKSRSQTLVKRQHDQTDSMISSKRKKTETRLPVKDVSLKISLPIKEQFSIVSISDDKKSAPVSKISSSEQDVLESMPLSPISILQKSLSLSNLTQDIEAEFNPQRKCKSDLMLNGHDNNDTNNNDVWFLFSGKKDINKSHDLNLTVDYEQNLTKEDNRESLRSLQTHSILRSLSMSNLTQDTESQPSKFTRFKSVPDLEKSLHFFQYDILCNNSSLLLMTSNEIANIARPGSQEPISLFDKTKSLSLSNLTSDVMKFPVGVRRCKSAMTITDDSMTLNFTDSPELQEIVDGDEEYIPSYVDELTTDCESSEKEYYGDLDAGKIRRHKAKPSEWSKNKTKALRLKGEEYIGYQKPRGERATHDILRPARQLGETCKSDFCKRSKLRGCSQFTEETRKKIHCNFWKNLNWDQRKIFVSGLVKRAATNRKTIKNESSSRRQGTLQYSLPLTSKGDQTVQVCREMFLSTLSLGSYTVQSWVKKAKFGMSAQKANSPRLVKPNEANKKKMLALQTFLNNLPKLPSHYARKDSSKLYLEPMYKSLADLFKIYKEFCSKNNETPVCRYTFEKTFDEKNLSLLTLKKDMCDVCSAWLAGNLNDPDYQMHIIKKNRARKEKVDDKKRAAKREFILLTMDLQSVKVCPYLTASALYFKTKLTCHNFTVYNMTNHHCTCYWFNETAADLTANTFASFLLDYLERHCLSLKLPIVIFSDGCTYQNRNVNLANALLNFSKLHGITITQKFLVPGHTQMECDSVHSAIERRLKNREIHLPSDYSTVAKEARNRSPYEVVTIDHEFIKNYADHKNWVYKSIRPGRKAGEAQVTDIRAIKYTPDCKIQVKLDFDDDWFDLPQRQRVINHEVTYQRLHSGPIPISSTKYNHLQQLKSVIPQDCHAFYDNLPKSN